jgi:hypothetical protein
MIAWCLHRADMDQGGIVCVRERESVSVCVCVCVCERGTTTGHDLIRVCSALSPPIDLHIMIYSSDLWHTMVAEC